jgi:hypothetical protein
VDLRASSIVVELPPSSTCCWCRALVLLEAVKPLGAGDDAEVEE